MGRQTALKFKVRGGARDGAGRPRTRPHPGLNGPGVPHLKREAFPVRHPLHVTMRMQPGAGYLRGYRRSKAVQSALREARVRFGVRIVHYSIQGNHLHLIVEANGVEALSRAMQGLAIRMAKQLNAISGRRGGVFADRYHSRVLSSRRQVANAVRYVLGNYRHHVREYLPPRWEDPLSSARFLRALPGADAVVIGPRTWLLRVGLTREPSSVRRTTSK